MDMSVNILGYEVFSGDKEELLSIIQQYEKVNIISGNPQILDLGLNDEKLKENFMSKNSIIIPDGVGTVFAAKMIKTPVKEKIAGIEVMDSILKECNENGKGVYLIGAEQDILDACVLNIKTKYENLNILGSHNGFFDLDNCEEIINDIKNKKPYALFVAMGAPRQENFIINYMEELPVNVFMGVGGSFDIFAGKISRAPKWMINLGLEWLYRVYKEPFRIKRLGCIPKFIIKAIKEK